MIEYKIGGVIDLPFVLLDSTTGNPVFGKVASDLTASCRLADGTFVTLLPNASSTVSELTYGDFFHEGWYVLSVTALGINVSGELLYTIKGTGLKTYRGTVKLVAYEEVDTFDKLGEPYGGKVGTGLDHVETLLSGKPSLAEIEASTVLANKTDVASVTAAVVSGVPHIYAPTAASAIVGAKGSIVSGTYASLAALDGSELVLAEVAGQGLEYIAEFSGTLTDHIPSQLTVNGYYNGGATHQIDVSIWNYTTSAWQFLFSMLNRTSSFPYAIGLTADHHSSGNMRVRFNHITATYNNAHRLNLDQISITKVESTASLVPQVANIYSAVTQLSQRIGADSIALPGTLASELATKPTLAAIEGSTVLAKQSAVLALPTLTQMEASTALASGSTVTRASPTAVYDFGALISGDVTALNTWNDGNLIKIVADNGRLMIRFGGLTTNPFRLQLALKTVNVIRPVFTVRQELFDGSIYIVAKTKDPGSYAGQSILIDTPVSRKVMATYLNPPWYGDFTIYVEDAEHPGTFESGAELHADWASLLCTTEILPLYPEDIYDNSNHGGAGGGGVTLSEIESSAVIAKQSTLNQRPTLAQMEASPVLSKGNNVYLMRAWHTVAPTMYVYWESPNAPDTTGALAPYPGGELSGIMIVRVL